jgi:hypothetical protein
VPRDVLIVDNFSPDAARLRGVFDERFADPRSTRADRFAWDYWHVPGQYTALRTPAWTYFPKAMYERFHRALVAWGRETLGCHDISPPWLSLYIEGCKQELHGDLPHGPWAFVYSLTPWKSRVFDGGETLLVRDEVLDFWQDFASVRGVEERELIRAIEPRMNRLTVFDPRIPHGVRRVSGTHNPREGRLVIHGWFVQPRPIIVGPLRTNALADHLLHLTDRFGGYLRRASSGPEGSYLPVAGLVSFAFDVDRSGRVRDVRVLSDTTRVPRAEEKGRRRVIAQIRKDLAAWRFPSQRGPSRVTLPFVFERG